MDFFELIQQRYSCRAYQPKPVARELLLRCVEAARLAPSACNSQPWQFLLADQPDLVAQIAPCFQDAGMNRFCSDAPAFVLVTEQPATLTARVGAALNRQYFAQTDLGLAVMQFCLAATELGLGTCIIGWIHRSKLVKLLGLPKGTKLRLAVCIGWPADAPREKKRKPMEEIFQALGKTENK